ncbi:60S ribosomal subunit assembly/export protein LOC1 [Hirsutella rhossiliensis]|uniref:60S ribosomal subunit assembly/export protein LOC1 n=1 Tax=Hirsutella rhossiliensis TaxID=111463 RepID=A0A9P8SJC2_9HYPO|nr:60S ribosomal subunit assembly/export protein LOC1 [Hirsutella rhossiliensis]KAH0965148.1 60S ribosomal subunit assembly/export protein LOC1 [Hirsutella rhossiliensis]
MAPTRTRTVKNKHAAPKSDAPGKGAKRSSTDGVSKSKKPTGAPPSKQLKEKNRAALVKRPKKKTYTEEELGIPKLNMITPVGVVKPRGKKKGKVFVDDTKSMDTILAMVQAEKNGQIESKMIKARQMEEIREARKVEAAKKEAEKKAKLEDTKKSLRKKRKRKGTDVEDESIRDFTSPGSKAAKPKKKVSFA